MTRSRTPRKGAKRRASSRSWLGWLFKLSLVGLVLLAGFAVYLDAVVQEKFSGKRWTVPAKVYARPLELFVGQKLSKDDSTPWDHNASDATIAKVQAKLKEHGIKAVNYGVVGISKNEAQARKVFEFAKKMGLRAVTTELPQVALNAPAPNDVTETLDTIEKLVKEYDIMVGFHDHPRQPNNPKYRMWDPYYILEVTKNRDSRIGACADTGHWQTSGLNPVWCLRVLKGRIISSHMKDKLDYGQSHDVPYGTGVGEIGRCLDELKKQGFQGNISIEYEYNWTGSVPDITKCIDFVKAHKPSGS